MQRTIINSLKEAIPTPTGSEPIPLGSGVITRLLGNGGMASVYEIWNQQLEIFRAVKLIHPNCNCEALERFQTEIKITAKLHHPNIIETHGVGLWNNLPYIEMEKAEGVTLEALIHERGALPVSVCIAIGILVTRALEYAHNQEYMLYNKSYHGIIHRDLKPANIMISLHQFVKLMDFGIARPTDTSFHTIDGTIVGTIQYLSPEQLSGHPLDVRTDIYSLGTCLYEAACGNYAFPEINITRLLADKAKNRFCSLNDYSTKFPEKFIKIIHQCMNHDRNNRPKTAAHLCEELEHLHHKITRDKPEDIIKSYMESTSEKMAIVVPVKHISVKLTILSLFILTFSIYGVVSSLLVKSKVGKVVSLSHTIQNSSIGKTYDTIPKKLKISQISVESGEIANVQNLNNTNPVTNLKNAKNDRIDTQPENTKETMPSNNKIQDTLIDALFLKYNTRNLIQIMQNEINSGNLSNVLKLYKILPPQLSSGNVAIILNARALKKLNDVSLSMFLEKISIQEGEIFLYKAWSAFNNGKLNKAEEFLNKASISQLELISYEELSKEIYYLKALCASGRFDQLPDNKNWKIALESWYNVKKEMRTQPTHKYFTFADLEITRIGEKFRTAVR